MNAQGLIQRQLDAYSAHDLDAFPMGATDERGALVGCAVNDDHIQHVVVLAPGM